MSSLTTLASIFAVTKFLTVEAAQWVWNVYFNWYTEVTYFDMFGTEAALNVTLNVFVLCLSLESSLVSML